MKQFLLEPGVFRGVGIYPINEDKTIPDGDMTYTLEEYKELIGIDYRIVNERELNELREDYQKNRLESLEEITHIRFNEEFKEKPMRTCWDWADISFFFTSTTTNNKHRLYIRYKDRYYTALRPISMTDKEIVNEIKNIPWRENSIDYSRCYLTELEELSSQYLMRYLHLKGHSWDKSINSISREIIKRYAEKYDEVYLGNVFIPDALLPEDYKPVKYTGQLILDGEYLFIVPIDDFLLYQHIERLNYLCKTNPTKQINKEINKQMNAILNRVYLLKGRFLNWDAESFHKRKRIGYL